MSPNPFFLLLRLESPLQSWGIQSRWEIRNTAMEPTKSGVIGLLACALGYAKDDPRIVAELDHGLTMGIRVDKPGTILSDYQTIHGLFARADGRNPSEIETKLSSRDYLEDAKFLVVLGGETHLLQRLRDALLSPVWPIYLGRKCCIPTRPVFEALTDAFPSMIAALKGYPMDLTTFNASRYRIPAQLQIHMETSSIHEPGIVHRQDKRTLMPSGMYDFRSVKIDVIPTPHANSPNDLGLEPGSVLSEDG